MRTKNWIMYGAIGAAVYYFLIRKKPAAASSGMKTISPEEFAAQMASPGAVNTSRISTVDIQKAIVQAPTGLPGHIVITQPLSTQQIKDAVLAAIGVSGSSPAPSISVINTAVGGTETLHTSTFAAAAALEGLSVEEWGRKYRFW